MVFASALLLGAFLLAAGGAAPQLLFPSDDAAYLDACYRASLGQWLGRDFSSPIGPAALLPTVVVMKLGGASINALVFGSALTWLVYGMLAWFATRERMPVWLAAAFALFVAATAAAPYTLDFGAWNILSYGMLYNRLAWAALCVAAGAALLPQPESGASNTTALSLGACAVWLWALKPNYLLILGPLFLYQCWLASHRGAWLLRATLGASIMLGFVWFSVRFSPVGYVGTHLGMAREAPSGLLAYTFLRSLRENFWLVLALVTIWGAALKTGATLPLRRGLALTVIGVIASTFAANLTNCQFSEIPLWGALGWLGASYGLCGKPGTGAARFAGVAGVACGLAFMWQPIASVAYNFTWKHYRAPGSPPALQVDASTWQGLPMCPAPGEISGPSERLDSPGNYAAWLNDGLALLARVSAPHEPVLCLDWTNPFPFATARVPIVGDEIAWHVGRTVGASHHPDVNQLLAAAVIVMEPRRSIQPDSLAFKRALFATALETSFMVGGETAHWRAWVRRAPPLPALSSTR